MTEFEALKDVVCWAWKAYDSEGHGGDDDVMMLLCCIFNLNLN